SPASVTAFCHNGLGGTVGPFRARRVVITVPHAVLKVGSLSLDPPVAGVAPALGQIEARHGLKIGFQFRHGFGAEPDFLEKHFVKSTTRLPDLNFIHAPGEPLPTWWTGAPAQTATITAWAGGPKAEQLLNESPSTRVRTALDALSSALG